MLYFRILIYDILWKLYQLIRADLYFSLSKTLKLQLYLILHTGQYISDMTTYMAANESC